MNTSKIKTVVAIGITLVLVVGLIMVARWRSSRAAALEKSRQAAKIETALHQIQQVNVGLADYQVQAKQLIFTALIQKKIPAAAKWCETLNVNGKLWATTPTNTPFAINSRIAGRAYSKTNRMAGDVVVFFETAEPGWNLAGGSELLTTRPEGAAVALADGRSMNVNAIEAAKLRWAP